MNTEPSPFNFSPEEISSMSFEGFIKDFVALFERRLIVPSKDQSIVAKSDNKRRASGCKATTEVKQT